jgi:hypothetical protein
MSFFGKKPAGEMPHKRESGASEGAYVQKNVARGKGGAPSSINRGFDCSMAAGEIDRSIDRSINLPAQSDALGTKRWRWRWRRRRRRRRLFFFF